MDKEEVNETTNRHSKTEGTKRKTEDERIKDASTAIASKKESEGDKKVDQETRNTRKNKRKGTAETIKL